MDGLLIDWGGVLTTSMLGAFDAFSVREGLDEHAVRKAFRDDPEARGALIALESGAIDLPTFEQRTASALGVAAHDLSRRLTAEVQPDAAMLDLVKRVHDAGIRTALVSNSWRATDYGDLSGLFDAVVLSQPLGFRKPDPRIYETALQALGLPATSCVFVDDLGGNLKPARALGMATIRHETAEKTIPQIERLLLDSPS
jgi:epoxide hydrolase-like predicted phosphatase